MRSASERFFLSLFIEKKKKFWPFSTTAATAVTTGSSGTRSTCTPSIVVSHRLHPGSPPFFLFSDFFSLARVLLLLLLLLCLAVWQQKEPADCFMTYIYLCAPSDSMLLLQHSFFFPYPPHHSIQKDIQRQEDVLDIKEKITKDNWI